jgi:hypothetical protein
MLPAKAAAERLRYAPDYVTKLCRDGKLDCIQIGGEWYIARKSLSTFQETRELEKAARALNLSEVRRQQLHPSGSPSIRRSKSAFLPVVLLFASIVLGIALSIFFLVTSAH